MVNVNCKSMVYMGGFCEGAAGLQTKKIPTLRSGSGVRGNTLAAELVGEGVKNPARWPGGCWIIAAY